MGVSTKDGAVPASLQDEINSITVDDTTQYQPEAWTREGHVD